MFCDSKLNDHTKMFCVSKLNDHTKILDEHSNEILNLKSSVAEIKSKQSSCEVQQISDTLHEFNDRERRKSNIILLRVS